MKLSDVRVSTIDYVFSIHPHGYHYHPSVDIKFIFDVNFNFAKEQNDEPSIWDIVFFKSDSLESNSVEMNLTECDGYYTSCKLTFNYA